MVYRSASGTRRRAGETGHLFSSEPTNTVVHELFVRITNVYVQSRSIASYRDTCSLMRQNWARFPERRRGLPRRTLPAPPFLVSSRSTAVGRIHERLEASESVCCFLQHRVCSVFALVCHDGTRPATSSVSGAFPPKPTDELCT